MPRNRARPGDSGLLDSSSGIGGGLAKATAHEARADLKDTRDLWYGAGEDLAVFAGILTGFGPWNTALP